jgi:transposase
MVYIVIDIIAKRKFDYCIINSEMNKLRTEIIINNNNGLKEFLKITYQFPTLNPCPTMSYL